MYQSVVIHEPLPATFTSYIVRRPAPEGLIVADIALQADDGRVLAEFGGFTMRVAQRNYLEESEANAAAARPVVATDHHRPTDEGVPPEVGVRLTLDLLASRPPRHVLVRPFRDGQPVPPPSSTVDRSFSPVRGNRRSGGLPVGALSATIGAGTSHDTEVYRPGTLGRRGGGR
jgi:hypothetical protein